MYIYASLLCSSWSASVYQVSYRPTANRIFISPSFSPHPNTNTHVNGSSNVLAFYPTPSTKICFFYHTRMQVDIQISFTSTPPPPHMELAVHYFFSALAPSLLTVKTLPCHTRRFGMRTMRGDHPGAGKGTQLWLHCGRIGATQTYTLRAGSIQRSALAYSLSFSLICRLFFNTSIENLWRQCAKEKWMTVHPNTTEATQRGKISDFYHAFTSGYNATGEKDKMVMIKSGSKVGL